MIKFFNVIFVIKFKNGKLSFVYPIDTLLLKILQYFEGVSIVHPKLTMYLPSTKPLFAV